MGDDAIERVPWDEFLTRFRWRQGEHVSFVGPTGSGKTTLAAGILHKRAYVCALGTKPVDETLTSLIKRDGYKKIKTWPPPPIIGRSQRVVLWPTYNRPEDVRNQQDQFANAMAEMFAARGWTVFADELWYLCHILKMSKVLEAYWSQGRAMKLSLVGGTQRPAHIPVLMYSSATHLFLYRDNDEVNLKRIGGIGSFSANLIRDTVKSLPKHDALYVNTRDETMMITRAERR